MSSEDAEIVIIKYFFLIEMRVFKPHTANCLPTRLCCELNN